MKRLAKRYAEAYAETTWIGHGKPKEGVRIEKDCEDARKKLFDAIDEITSTDITPRAVQEGY